MRNFEQWQDRIGRLFPEYSENKISSKDKVLSQSITLQVTDDCNLACFVAGTKVLMSDFTYKNIEDIKIGDEVLAFDEHTEKGKQLKLISTKVTHTFYRHDFVRKITTEDNESIICTDEHPFLDGRRSWVRAEDINTDKKLIKFLGFNNFIEADVKFVEKLSTYVPVYNLETETHTYIANNFAVHNCSYCYQVHKGKRRMSLETAKKYIDLIISGEKGFSDYVNPEKSPGIILEFIGGEPFLEIDLIDQICDYFSQQLIEKQHPWATKYIFSICSNGVLYFDERVQRFLRKWNGHISFSVTIDGNKELHDSCRKFPDGRPSYDLAVAAATDWMSKGYYMGSKITIAPENVTFLYDAIKHMIELGYTEINANCVYEKGWEPKHAMVLYEEMKKISDYFLDNNLDFDHEYYCSLYNEDFFKPKKEDDLDNWCGGNGLMLACDPDGYLFPCLRYMESSLGGDQIPYSIGHVDIGICQTECDKCRVECLRKIDRRTQSTDECFNCPIAEGCSWCTAYNYQVFGTPDSRATYICIMHKARALGNAYFWNKYYRKNNINKRMKINVPDEWALEIINETELNMLKELSKED